MEAENAQIKSQRTDGKVETGSCLGEEEEVTTRVKKKESEPRINNFFKASQRINHNRVTASHRPLTGHPNY